MVRVLKSGTPLYKTHAHISPAECYLRVILVPRAHDPFGLRQGSRPLAGTKAGSPRITDFRLLYAASEI